MVSIVPAGLVKQERWKCDRERMSRETARTRDTESDRLEANTVEDEPLG